MTVLRLACSRCQRVCFERGGRVMIEGARDGSGSTLADEFIKSLESSKSKKDLQRLADIAVRLEEYSIHGTLAVPRELNQLTSILSEIKAGDVRFPFYETNTCHSRVARLTHGFVKRQQRTPRKEIHKAEWVYREDSASDARTV